MTVRVIHDRRYLPKLCHYCRLQIDKVPFLSKRYTTLRASTTSRTSYYHLECSEKIGLFDPSLLRGTRERAGPDVPEVRADQVVPPARKELGDRDSPVSSVVLHYAEGRQQVISKGTAEWSELARVASEFTDAGNFLSTLSILKGRSVRGFTVQIKKKGQF